MDEKQEERHGMCNLVRLHIKVGVSVKAMEVTNCGGRQKLFYTCALECFASLQAKECVHGHKDKLRHYSVRCSTIRHLSSWLLVNFKPVKSSVTAYLMPRDLITQEAFKNIMKWYSHYLTSMEQSGKCSMIIHSRTVSSIQIRDRLWWTELIHQLKSSIYKGLCGGR